MRITATRARTGGAAYSSEERLAAKEARGLGHAAATGSSVLGLGNSKQLSGFNVAGADKFIPIPPGLCRTITRTICRGGAGPDSVVFAATSACGHHGATLMAGFVSNGQFARGGAI